MKAALVAAFFFPAVAHAESCTASYYSSGKYVAYKSQRYHPLGLTAAHRTLPFGTKLRVTYENRSVSVTVNDRGPFFKGRCLDLSLGAARAIGLTGAGVG